MKQHSVFGSILINFAANPIHITKLSFIKNFKLLLLNVVNKL